MNLAPEFLGLSAGDAGPDRWLSVDFIDTILPLSRSTAPVDIQPTADAFRALLFDPPSADGTQRRTYAILDAAVCQHLPELLETSDLEHRCFFTGDAFEETGDVAPWLVALEPDHRLTRMLISISDRPGGLWDLQPGIILKSSLDFAAKAIEGIHALSRDFLFSRGH